MRQARMAGYPPRQARPQTCCAAGGRRGREKPRDLPRRPCPCCHRCCCYCCCYCHCWQGHLAAEGLGSGAETGRLAGAAEAPTQTRQASTGQPQRGSRRGWRGREGQGRGPGWQRPLMGPPQLNQQQEQGAATLLWTGGRHAAAASQAAASRHPLRTPEHHGAPRMGGEARLQGRHVRWARGRRSACHQSGTHAARSALHLPSWRCPLLAAARGPAAADGVAGHTGPAGRGGGRPQLRAPPP